MNLGIRRARTRMIWQLVVALAMPAFAMAGPAQTAPKQGRAKTNGKARAKPGTAQDNAAAAVEDDSSMDDKARESVEPGRKYVYKVSGGQPQELEVYFPSGWDPSKNRAPGVMMFHGGGWSGGNLSQFRYACQYFASRGLVAATANYRMLTAESKKSLPEGESRKRVCIIDAKSAIRWMKQHAAELGVDPKRIIVGGGSAGGHLAVLANINTDLNDPNDPKGIDAKAIAFLLFNPAFTLDGKDHDNQVDVFPLLKPGLAPSIMFFGTKDRWKNSADVLVKKIKEQGDETSLWTAEGQGHSFFNRQPWYDLALIEADRFLVAHGLLSGPCVIAPPKSGEKLVKAE